MRISVGRSLSSLSYLGLKSELELELESHRFNRIESTNSTRIDSSPTQSNSNRITRQRRTNTTQKSLYANHRLWRDYIPTVWCLYFPHSYLLGVHFSVRLNRVSIDISRADQFNKFNPTEEGKEKEKKGKIRRRSGRSRRMTRLGVGKGCSVLFSYSQSNNKEH